jgi:hypothetical protein
MSWDKEFQSIESQETNTTQYINKPCVEVVEIVECKLSEDVKGKDYKGTPFLQIVFQTEDGRKSTKNFFRVKDGDSEEAKSFKQKAIKELFANAGVDMKASGKKALVEIVGCKIKALFRAEEYIGYDADNNNKPEIRESIKYSYSGPADQELTGKSSYFHKALNPQKKATFDAELKTWERDNAPKKEKASPKKETAPASNDSFEDDDDDDLPF